METSKSRPTTAPREAVQLVVITIVVFLIIGTAKYLAIQCGLLHS